MLAAAGAAVVAVAVAVTLAVVLTGRSSSTTATTPAVGSLANGLPGAAEVEALLRGIPQRGLTLGSARAPVTLVEYVDLQCPYCRVVAAEVLPSIVRRYVRTGKVRLVLRPWAFIGPDSTRGQSTVLAAALQQRAFNVAELLYDHQGTENTGWLSDDLIAAVAASVPGLRVQRLLDDRSSAAVEAAAARVDRQARADGVAGTPTLLVGTNESNGTKVEMSGPTDRESVVRALDAALGS